MSRISNAPEGNAVVERISGKTVGRALLVGTLLMGSIVGGVAYVKRDYDREVDGLVNDKPAPNEICIDLTGVDANNTVIWDLADEYADGSQLVEDTDDMTDLLARGGSIAYCRVSGAEELDANKVRNANLVPSKQFVPEDVYSDAGGVSTDIG